MRDRNIKRLEWELEPLTRDDVMLNKNGFKYTDQGHLFREAGKSFDTITQEEIEVIQEQLNQLRNNGKRNEKKPRGN